MGDITHEFVSAKSDGGDATLVRPSDWNAPHVVEGTIFDVFGDGQDGDVTINSGAFTVAVGGTNLITNNVLQRDAYFNNLTLNGGDLQTNGFKVFVKETLTMTSGVIRHYPSSGPTNGNNGTGAAGGTGGLAGAGANGATTTNGVLGTAGGNGGFNANGLQPPATPTAITVGRTAPANGAQGGPSGQGQTGGQRNATASTNALGDRLPWTHLFTAILFRQASGLSPTLANFVGQAVAGGGGAGSPSSGGGGGGGSGGSGGAIVLAARVITGTTNIVATGIAGANGGNGGGTNAGGGAGGNGGSGGWITLIYRDKSGWSGTYDVSGGGAGTGGTGIGTGSNGTNGSSGNVGIVKEFQV